MHPTNTKRLGRTVKSSNCVSSNTNQRCRTWPWTATATRRFILDSQLKIGQFGFSQQDLVIPVSGYPLSVIRTYNSLRAQPSVISEDFGPGWTYSIQTADGGSAFVHAYGQGRLKRITDRNGNRTEMVNEGGAGFQPARIDSYNASNERTKSIIFQRDAQGRIIELTTTDPLGNTTTRTHDGFGNLLTGSS